MLTIQPIVNSTASLIQSPSVGGSATSDNLSARQTIAFSASSATNTNADTAASASSSGIGDTSGQSSSFLAQLFSQSATVGDISLTTTSAQFTPAPEYDTFVEYSFVKYKPSFAGLPQAASTSASTAAATELDTSLTPASSSDFQAYNNTQSRNQSSLLSEQSSINIAG